MQLLFIILSILSFTVTVGDCYSIITSKVTIFLNFPNQKLTSNVLDCNFPTMDNVISPMSFPQTTANPSNEIVTPITMIHKKRRKSANTSNIKPTNNLLHEISNSDSNNINNNLPYGGQHQL